jgi:hypothetical protein
MQSTGGPLFRGLVGAVAGVWGDNAWRDKRHSDSLR